MAGDKIMEVAAGLMFHGGRLLITQRLPGEHLGGLWEFPGGKRESGETFEECLFRELREELGINVEVGELVGSISHEYPERKVLIKFFRCNIILGEPKSLDCQDLKWVEADELANFEFPPADTQLLQRLRNETKWWVQSGPGNQMKGTEQ
ncbi:MAG: 8-oxo-dGTP diphosphatase MutT [Verrucomicrobiota bacterium]|nr:8-oxo-dGTP diphosphatase MutT [Verrucomicrobiota bacterium]